jgi:hypothetical protein
MSTICKTCRERKTGWKIEHYDNHCQVCGNGKKEVPEGADWKEHFFSTIEELASIYKVCLSCSSQKQICQVCGETMEKDGLGLDFSKEVKDPQKGVWYDAETHTPPLSLSEEYRNKLGWIHRSEKVYLHTISVIEDGEKYTTGVYDFEKQHWDAGMCNVLYWTLLPEFNEENLHSGK